MQEIAVIIPFFQQEPGILARALESVASQHIPEGWSAEVIVVDDGSPRPAEDEVRSLRFPESLQLRVIRQRNGGAAAARNRGLDEASPSATLIAFLDSDDEWRPDHLRRAVAAYRSGFDFYFTDNRRAGHHDSHVRSHCGPEIGRFIASAQQEHGILEVPNPRPPLAVVACGRRGGAAERWEAAFRALLVDALAGRASTWPKWVWGWGSSGSSRWPAGGAAFYEILDIDPLGHIGLVP